MVLTSSSWNNLLTFLVVHQDILLDSSIFDALIFYATGKILATPVISHELLVDVCIFCICELFFMWCGVTIPVPVAGSQVGRGRENSVPDVGNWPVLLWRSTGHSSLVIGSNHHLSSLFINPRCQSSFTPFTHPRYTYSKSA